MLSRASEWREPSIIEALRSATRSLHANLSSSAAMSRLFASDYTFSEYRAHLEQLPRFFERLESVASRQIGTETSPFVIQGSRDLREDLRTNDAYAAWFPKSILRIGSRR